ncbi:MAG: Non-ribosomal peptide synthetase module [Podila humilis]|nr:MAG: Non-ribosomal peptide synthetase module [Podila humilis]
MPLNNNGKVDRRSLPEPDSTFFVTQDYVAPLGEIEAALASVWCQLLKIERVSRDDNFFMLGGHSLLATRLLNRVSTTLGVQLPMSMLFQNPALSGLAEVIQRCIAQDDLIYSAISPTARDGLSELSFAQQRLWFLTQMEGMSEIYHVPTALRLHGNLNQFILSKALNTLYARHESLRSRFVVVSGQPKVHILPPDSIMQLVITDLRQEQDREVTAKEIAAQEAIASFDLEKGPLARARLIQLTENHHIFLLTMHHIITDGWSMGVLFRELNELYMAYVKCQSNPLIPLSIQYPDYAAWQRQWLTEDRLKVQATFWHNALAGAPVTITLPTDRPRPRQQSFAGSSVPIRLDAQLTSALDALCHKHGVTMFMAILAAWSAVLSRLSGQDDVVIGTPVANRNHPQVEQLIGFFVNTLALRIDLSGEPKAEQILNRVRKTTIAAQAHQDMPFEQVVEIVQPPRRMDQTPIFQVMFTWQNNDLGSLQLQDVEAVPERLRYDVVKFDLELQMGDDNGQVKGGLRYSTALFDHQTIERHVGYLEAMLRWMTGTTQQTIEEAPILGSPEQKLLLETWNDTHRPYPDSACIHHLFEIQARSSPEAIAIVQDDRSMTYRELDSRANRIAHQLVTAGVQSGEHVAILLERSIDLVASQIAILKVGAAYVPIDTKAPVERKAYMVADSGARLLVTDEAILIPDQIKAAVLRLGKNVAENVQDDIVLHVPASIDTEAPVVRLRTDTAEDTQDAIEAYVPASSSMNTAYIMYTSGSTGLPKGVMVSHRGVARLAFNNGFADFASEDRVAFSSNPSFDPSTFEVWAPLLNGARIVIIDRETFLDPHCLAEALLHHQVTFLHMTNALLHQYAFIIGEPLSQLRYLTGAAEQGSIEAYNAVLQHGGPVRVINRYGPTEATVDVTAYTATSCLSNMERLPIGQPVGNTRVYVLDKYLVPVPIGAAGELYIGGPGVANGYLNRPELTAERFLLDPFSNAPGARMYKTGDLVRYLSDGELVFLGRRDNQIKIRGYRVELGEIEVRLVEHSAVREAVVVVTGEGSDKRLVAYVVSSQDNLARTLREHLSAALPEYMVPSAFVRLDTMPLNNNGKVDRQALPTPDPLSFVGRDYEAPQGKVEIALADVWASLLRIEQVGRHDNFFMLGGHSLLAVKMIEQLRGLGYTLSVRALFDNPVLYTLAASTRLHQPGPEIPPNIITPTTTLIPNVLPLINLTQGDIDTIVKRVPGGAANIQDIYELSPLQEGILFHHLLATEGDPYLTMVCTAFRDRVLLDRYFDALQKVVDRHDILRTAIMWENMSTPAQIVLRKATLSITEHSLDPADGPIIYQLKQYYDPRKHRMDLSLAPLTRLAFAQDSDGRWIMLQLIHHLIGDHSTQEVIEEEVEAILSGDGNSLPAPQPFRNLIAQVRLGLSVEEHERFFRDMLQDIDTPSLPFGLSDVYNHGVNVIESYKRLPQDLNLRLRRHAKRLGVSLAAICHLAWAMVIASLSGQDRVVFGTVLFGRMQGGSGSDRAMGLFINTLPFRADVDGASVLNSVRKVQTHLAALLEHEHASLARAQKLSGVPSGMPLFSSLLNYRHNVAPVQAKRSDNGMQHIEAQERDNYPLAMSVEDFEHSLGLTAQVVQPHDPLRICDYMQQALQSLANALEQPSEIPIHRLHIMPAEEHELIVHSWNETDAPFPSDRYLHELFEGQAERSPSAVAVVQGDLSMTYGALNTRADQLAGTLIDMGVQPGDNVALMLNRSFELIIAQIAILKAGAAYVPIDVKAPASRQAYILSDSGAKLLLIDDSMQVHEQIETPLHRLDIKLDHADGSRVKTVPSRPTSGLHTACVMYTSGSTGLPKGVLVPHRAIVCRLLNNGCTEFTPDDCIAFVNNPSFDPSTSDVWGPLLHGARIAIIDNATLLDANHLSTALDRYQITSLDMPSALFHQYAYNIGPALSKLKYLVCGGEQGSIEAFSAVAQHGGPVRIFNAYGPTETTVNASMYEITGTIKQLERLPIGRPISNTRVYVLDKHLVPVPIGVAGELYIGGPGVANGYLNRPELTSECFIPDPFSNVPDTRMYKTGDLVRYLSDGELVFLGRRDNQIKIRGYRVELGEIEARLVENSTVREAVVVATGEGADKRLVAYVVVSAPEENFVINLRQDLAARLPEYMVPSAFVCLDVLPLTSNGKVNRRALPDPGSASFVVGEYEAPQGEDEVAMATIWCELLKRDRIGRHDDFFMLGGHSLLALRMIGAVRTRLGMDLKLQSLFSAPSIAELVQTVRQDVIRKNQDDEYSVLLPLKTRGNRFPLFCIHPAFGISWSYRGLMPHLHPEQPLYGLQARGLDGKTPLASSVEEMTLDYIDQIRKVQPHGPYNLLGWSFGGTVAHNMAVEFEKRGEQVRLLVIMDSLADYSGLTNDSLEEEEKHIAAQGFSGPLAASMDFAAQVDAENLRKRVLAVSSNNSRLAIRHSPSVVSGDIAFLCAAIPADDTKPLVDPATWKPLVLGNIEVHGVQCTHEEMNKPEHIAVVGRVVSARLEEIQRMTESS